MLLPFLNRLRVGSLKPQVFPGSQSFGYGSYAPVIQEYNTITVEIWGAGGGSGAASTGPGTAATDGGTSYFSAPSGPVYAFGGLHGEPGGGEGAPGAPGGPGSASGGDVNAPGSGNPGGPSPIWNSYYVGGAGGAGGYVRKTWTWGQPGSPIVGASYSLVCAGGGAGATYQFNGELNGYGGSNASARITWS
jgi:hypothetical protein